MLTTDVAIVGAGPAGLSAAIAAAQTGAKTTLFNEYVEPGGQLTKQIHKFFGSREHRAGVRGIDIAAQLMKEIDSLRVEKMMGTTVWSIFPRMGRASWSGRIRLSSPQEHPRMSWPFLDGRYRESWGQGQPRPWSTSSEYCRERRS
jgi:2-polyprenyl-6-methoxyphenol hydroxylase-like FAD-dependent oxidoreductase